MTTRIAIVDDDQTFLTIIKELLTDEGYQPLICDRADAALEVLRRQRPALVILDIRMASPRSGWELLEALWADPLLAQTPILVCTADAPFIDQHGQSLRARGCGVLAKPFDLDDLLTHVRRLLARSPTTPPPAAEWPERRPD